MEDISSFPIQILWLLIVDLAAFGLGRRCYRGLLLDEGDHSLLEEICFSLILGFLVCGMLLFIGGVVGLLYGGLVAVALVILALLGAMQLRSSIASARSLLADSSVLLQDPLLAVSVGLFFLFLPRCFAPEIEFDSLSYHLELPKRYLEEHAMVTILPSLAANMPHAMEVLQILSLSGGGFVTAKLFLFQWNVLILCGLVIFSRRHLERPLAGVMGLLYLGGPIVQWHLGTTCVEPALGCVLLFYVLALLRWRSTQRRSWLMTSSLLLGWAMSFKYTAWLWASGPLLAILGLVLSRRDWSWRKRRHTLLAAAACIALPVVPWLIKSLVTTGNPIYPNLPGLLGGAWWSELQQQQFLHEIHRIGFERGERTLWEHLKLPFRLVFPGPLVYRAAQPLSAALTAMALVAPLLPWSYRRGAWLLPLMIYPGLLLWATGETRDSRYLVALLPLLSIMAVVSLRPLFEHKITSFGVAVVASLSLLAQLEAPVKPWLFLDSARSRQVAEDKNLTGLWNRIHRELPTYAKLFLFFENRVLFLEREAIIDPVFEAPTSLALLRRTGSPDAMAQLLRDQGVTHLVVNARWETRYFWERVILPPEDFLREERDYLQFFQRHTRLLFQHEHFKVFELLPAPGSEPEIPASPD